MFDNYINTPIKSQQFDTLRKYIASAWGKGERCILPHGDFASLESIEIIGSGGYISGQGRTQSMPSEYIKRGPSTCLIYKLFELKPLILYGGTDLVLKNLTLQGDYWGKIRENRDNINATRPPVAFQMTRPPANTPGDGLGTGKIDVNHVMVEWFDTGFLFGHHIASNNADESQFNGICSRFVKSLFKFVSIQALGININNVHAAFTENIFDVYAGGKHHHSNVTIVNSGGLVGEKETVLLRLRQGDGIGSNNWRWRIDEVSVDENVGEHFVLLRMDSPRNCHCIFDGGFIQYDNYKQKNKKLMYLKGFPLIETRGWENIQASTIEWESDTEKIPMWVSNGDVFGREVKYAIDVLSLETSKGPIEVHVTNARNQSGEKVDDFHGIVKGVIKQ